MTANTNDAAKLAHPSRVEDAEMMERVMTAITRTQSFVLLNNLDLDQKRAVVREFAQAALSAVGNGERLPFDKEAAIEGIQQMLECGKATLDDEGYLVALGGGERQAEEWLPIESAPKDGTWVLLYGERYGEPYVHSGFWGEGDDWFASEAASASLTDFGQQLTHWKPLFRPTT